MGVVFARVTHPCQPSPEGVAGSACTSTFSRLARRSLALRPAHSRGHQFVTRYPKASDISSPPCLLRLLPAGANRRVGLAPTGKRRLVTAHPHSGHSSTPSGSPHSGRVGMWRGGVRSTMSVAAPFVWRCLSGSAITPFPHPPGHRRRSPAPGSHRTWRADFPHQRSSAVGSQHCKRLQLPVGEAQFRCQQRCPFFDLVEGVPGEAAAGPTTAAQHPAPVTLHDPIYFDENSGDFRRRRNKHSGRVGRRLFRRPVH